MPACANCARELRPEWKFCVSCGMPTGVTAARPETKAIPIVVMAEPEPTPAPVEVVVDAPALALATAPPAAIASAPAPTLLVAPPEPEPTSPPLSIRTRSGRPRTRRRVNALAVVALILGCLASPLAALFGHLALHQITVAKEHGRIPALIAIVLGYGSLAFIVGLAIIYLTSHG